MAEDLIPVMIVDDNQNYREAFSRNLLMMDFDVIEADNSEEAMQLLAEKGPRVVVTDLQMRTETEGLDLIRKARDRYPLLPVIMISAVGTFEEGAMATQLGAAHVVHKNSIEKEIEALYDRIRASHKQYRADRTILRELRAIKNDDSENGKHADRLTEIISRPDVDQYLRAEAYDQLLEIQSAQLRSESQDKAKDVLARDDNTATLAEVEEQLIAAIPHYNSLEEDSREAIKAAELLYVQQTKSGGEFDFSRSIGFSYCFAVENEVKSSLRKRINRFLGQKDTYKLIHKLFDDKTKDLDLFFSQHLLRTLITDEMEITSENVKQTMQRIQQHQSRYKPDGLKAVGIMLICFGTTYTFKGMKGQISVDNPLNIKFTDGSELTASGLSEKLICLQHYRNPYIHPEISEMENIGKVRDSAIDCLLTIKELQ